MRLFSPLPTSNAKPTSSEAAVPIAATDAISEGGRAGPPLLTANAVRMSPMSVAMVAAGCGRGDSHAADASFASRRSGDGGGAFVCLLTGRGKKFIG